MATADGRFSLGVDVSKPLEEHGPGVYTVVLIAVLEDDQDRDETTISEYSIFYGTLLPSAYAPKRWVDREAREDQRTAQHYPTGTGRNNAPAHGRPTASADKRTNASAPLRGLRSRQRQSGLCWGGLPSRR